MAKEFFERFREKYTIDEETGCWMWHGAKCRNYAGITHERVLKIAHRIYYELTVSSIPEGLECDHLCKRTLCVNPAHIELVTHSENCKRGTHAEKIRDRARIVTHCPKGHPYAGNNLYVKPNGRRECRECVRESGRRYAIRVGKSSGKKTRQSSLGKLPRQESVTSRSSWIEKENQ